MIPPIYNVCIASDAVKTLFGDGTENNPLRVFSFASAGDAPIPSPYVTWATIGGSPNNYLGDIADRDHHYVQIDVWDSDPDNVITAATAVRDAIELAGYVDAYRGLSRDVETKLYRVSFDAYVGVDR